MIVIIIIIGLILGSFTNNLISFYCGFSKFDFRRSKCFCGKKDLSAYELIPILNFILLNGKCKHCKAEISIRYPLVELISAILLLLCYELYSFSFYFFLYGSLTISLLIIAVVDYYKFIIPNSIVIFILSLSCLKIAFEKDLSAGKIFTPVIILFLFTGINFLVNKLKQKSALGFGDIKLLSSLSLLFSITSSLIGIWFSSFIAVPGFLIIKLFNKRFRTENKVPFGLFIAIGYTIILFFEPAIDYFLNYYRGL
jgi:leader peptidase (prepilin peptidase) / N-methyltransferase